MVDMPARLEERILAARLEFMATIGGTHAPVCLSGGIPAQPAEQPEAQPRFAFYCRDVFVYSQSVLENLLFGQVKDDRPGELERAQELAVAALEEAGLLSEILAVGLDFDVGSLGGRLSGGQRQKTSLARALLKEPRILILDEATASLDNASQARIQRYLETELKGRCTVIAVIHRLDIVRGYDRIAVFRSGRVVESGTYDQLMAQGGLFRELALGAGGTEGTEWTGGAEVAGWPGEPEGERGIPAGLRPGAV
jgi:ABC-type multidrug transport system fused ATPase/permease subunit